ncbi:MAG: hypothetical protein IIZ45_05145 [Firmicutes bacterium]|nr:hypothetical protein [Bacillota bacterium]
MAMYNGSNAYKQAYEQQNEIRVLDGKQARKRERAKNAAKVRVVVSVAAIFMVLLAMTVISAKTYSLGVEINALKTQIEDVETATARAEMEMGELCSLERIEAYAKNNLGMVYPGADDFYYLTMETPVVAEAVGESAAPAEEPAENSLWDRIVNSVTSFFRGTASASEY